MGKAETKYANTAKKMDDALVDLLKSKDFDQISVTEICAEAAVNRSTFYAHYSNTTDLLAEVKESALREFFSSFEHLSENLDFLSREYLLIYLDFLERNKVIFHVILSNADLFAPESIFSDFSQLYADGVFSKEGSSAMNANYKLRYIASGITSVASMWLDGGCKESKSKMADIILDCIHGDKR